MNMSSKTNTPSYQRTNGNNYNRNNKSNQNKKKDNKTWIWIALAVVLVVAIILIIVFTTGDGKTTGKQNANGDLVIPLDEITKNIKVYSVKVDGVKMEILVAKTSSGSIRTAFNTCEVCFDSGKGYYKVSGNKATCQNCGYTYTVDQFNTAKDGGCKPVAITSSERQEADGNLIIPISTMRANKHYF